MRIEPSAERHRGKGTDGRPQFTLAPFTEIPHQSGHQHRQFFRNSRIRSYALAASASI